MFYLRLLTNHQLIMSIDYTKITCINPKCDGQKIEGSHYCNNRMSFIYLFLIIKTIILKFNTDICEASKCCLQRLPSYCYCRQRITFTISYITLTNSSVDRCAYFQCNGKTSDEQWYCLDRMSLSLLSPPSYIIL